MDVVFSPNPYESHVTIGGGAIPSDNPEGKEFYFKTERTNYYISSPTLPPTFEIKYGAGWSPKDAEIKGTFIDKGYGRIAAYVDWANELTKLEFDGSRPWGLDLDGSIIGIKDGRIENVTYGKWDATKTVKEYNQDGTSETTTTETDQLRFADTGCWPGMAMDNIAPKCEASIETNIPLFLTQAQAAEYCRSGDTTGILNGDVPVEPNVYDYYLYNRISTTVGAGWDIQNLFRYKMDDGKRLAFYMHSDFGLDEYDRVLVGSDGIAQSYKGDYYGQDPFPDSNEKAMRALGAQRKMQSGTTYTPIMYETNIPTFDTLAHALNYIQTGDETGITDKWRTEEVQPGEIGDPTDETEQGKNGMVYSFGGGIFRLSASDLAVVYGEVFDPSPDVQEAILNGLKLFGSNQINALVDIMYLPINVDDVATLSSGSDIYLGSYKLRQTGDRVLKNDKIIDMGSVYFAPPYGPGDFRNYEPACKIYVMLPYAGTHELQISKYIGKNIGLKLAVDVTTGAATYYLFAGNTIMDSFDCMIGAHRPITATDQARYVSDAASAITQTSVQAISTVASAVKGGATMGNLAGTAGGAYNTVMSGYQAMQVLNDAPMTQRGGHSGAVSLFDVKQPYFVFAQQKPVQPSNLQQLKGKPSSAGGKMRNFSGYLECASVDLPSFSGTQAEAEELISILKGGVYID